MARARIGPVRVPYLLSESLVGRPHDVQSLICVANGRRQVQNKGYSCPTEQSEIRAFSWKCKRGGVDGLMVRIDGAAASPNRNG